MVKMPKVRLNNGNEMPAMGMGVVFLDDASGDDNKTQTTVDKAIEIGYRLFDNAAFYGNEVQIGQALKNNGIPREELFISTKLKCGFHKYEDTLSEFNKSMKKLQVDYLDLYLIHWPCPEHNLYTEAWRAMEHLYKEGYVKNIGLSNFDVEHVEKILDMCEVKPVINQLECNPYFTIEPLRKYLKEKGIITESWFPLGGGAVRLDGFPNPFKDKLLNEDILVKLAEKYGKSTAQIILKWHIQSGIVPVPKAANPAHMLDNVSIFDFEMTQKEVDAISALNKNNRCGPAPNDVNEYWT